MTTPAPTSTIFRAQAYALSPTYLQGPWGTKWIYSHSIIFDALADGAAYAVLTGMPSFAPLDGVPYIAQDRQIDQGPNESTLSFRIRLQQWLDLWRNAGMQRAVLRSLTSYLTPGSYTIETVNDTIAIGANSYTAWDQSIGGADPPTHFEESPGNWDWDGLQIPGRSWVIIFAGPWAQTPVLGGFNVGDGTVLGFDGTVNDAPSIRALVRKWKSAGNYVSQVILAFDATWYDPTLPPGDPKLPDGTWGTWGKVSTSTESIGPWGEVTTTTQSIGPWGEVNTLQVPGAEGEINFARVWGPIQIRTTTTATSAPSLTPIASRSTTTATSVRSFIPARDASSCFLGPVV